MARGRPDFFGTPVHPKYGTSKGVAINVSGGAVAPLVLATITAKGVIFGGFIDIADSDVSVNDHLSIDVDGVRFSYAQWQQWYDLGFFLGSNMPIVLTCFDPDSPRFAFELNRLIPFETSVVLTYHHAPATNVTVNGAVYYYDME